jgi:protein phosphatase
MSHQVCGATDVGRRRETNEDQYLVDPAIGVYAVADGMGGHAAGEVASQLAIETLSAALRRDGWPDTTSEGSEQERKTRTALSIRQAIAEANRKICEAVVDHAEWKGMGTTLVALAISGTSAIIGHVGDSRAYLVRAGQLSRLTSDHSWVNEQVKLGLLSPEDAQRHPWRNIVTRALGNRTEVDVDLLEQPIEPNDLFLLCSDGLNTMLRDGEIRTILEKHADNPEDACTELIAAANARGGEDNITVVVLQAE